MEHSVIPPLSLETRAALVLCTFPHLHLSLSLSLSLSHSCVWVRWSNFFVTQLMERTCKCSSSSLTLHVSSDQSSVHVDIYYRVSTQQEAGEVWRILTQECRKAVSIHSYVTVVCSLTTVETYEFKTATINVCVIIKFLSFSLSLSLSLSLRAQKYIAPFIHYTGFVGRNYIIRFIAYLL